MIEGITEEEITAARKRNRRYSGSAKRGKKTEKRERNSRKLFRVEQK